MTCEPVGILRSSTTQITGAWLDSGLRRAILASDGLRGKIAGNGLLSSCGQERL
jgi:hypothetical protein